MIPKDNPCASSEAETPIQLQQSLHLCGQPLQHSLRFRVQPLYQLLYAIAYYLCVGRNFDSLGSALPVFRISSIPIALGVDEISIILRVKLRTSCCGMVEDNAG